MKGFYYLTCPPFLPPGVHIKSPRFDLSLFRFPGQQGKTRTEGTVVTFQFLLSAMSADQARIEASFCEAIRIAKEQKSVSLEKRAEATYAKYCRQKASGS